MKYLPIFILCLCTTILSAQDKDELELQDRFWKQSSKKTKVTTFPDAWNSESAVILYKEESYKYTNNGKKMYNPSYTHQRVKLLDKAAVENFSEMSFDTDDRLGVGFINYYKEETTVGIKIIKADGTETILNIDEEAVTQDEEKRIAIPGLEIGDIIDMFVYQDDFQRSFGDFYEYAPVERVLSSKYPTVYSMLAVEVENDYYLNMESYNGAPKVKEVPTDKRATKKYVIEIENVEKTDFPRWYYPLVELPAIKFQVIFAVRSNSVVRESGFIGEDGERKNSVSNDEILDYYTRLFDVSNRKTLRNVLDHLEDEGITDKREQMVRALYFMRHRSYNRFIELVLARNNQISSYPMPCDTDYIILDEKNFVNYMAGLARNLEIDYDIVVATPNFNGSIDDLLLKNNVAYGLRFNFSDPLYFFELSPHVQAELFPYSLEGTKIFTLSVIKNRKIEAISSDVLPTTSASDNVAFEKLNVSFSEDFKNLNVERDLKYTGHFKIEELRSRLALGDFLNEEFKRYGTLHFYDCKKRQSRSNMEVEKKLNALLDTYKEEQEKQIEERTASNFDASVDEYSYEVINAARYNDDALHISDSFILDEEFVKKAGPNYLVEVGRLIGGQVQLKEDEKDRKLGVYLDYAKTFEYEVNITVPEGYEVVGLEKLNREVENNTGLFRSTATVNDGVLQYKTKKVYSKKTYPATDWEAMIMWLDSAYDFSQEKVMFKKV